MPNTHLGDDSAIAEPSRRVGRASSWAFRLILLFFVLWLGRTFQNSVLVGKGLAPEFHAELTRPTVEGAVVPPIASRAVATAREAVDSSVPGCPNVMTIDEIRQSVKLFNVRKARIRCLLDTDPPLYSDRELSRPVGMDLQLRSSSLSNWQRELYTHLGEGDLSKGMTKYDIPMQDAAQTDARLVTEISKQKCSFAESAEGPLSPLHKAADGPFAAEGYALVEFLYKVMFLQHGWIPVPVAGTALGSLRHFGMYEGDDDMDIVLYPPTRYLLQKESGEDRNGTRVEGEPIAAGWAGVYEDFDRHLRDYARQNPHFQWERRARLYDAPVGEHNTQEMSELHRTCPYSDYHRCISMAKRSCGAYYESRNRAELRRMFFPESGGIPFAFRIQRNTADGRALHVPLWSTYYSLPIPIVGVSNQPTQVRLLVVRKDLVYSDRPSARHVGIQVEELEGLRMMDALCFSLLYSTAVGHVLIELETLDPLSTLNSSCLG